MRKRIRKAIKASWRLPETLYASRFLVLLSRSIIVLTALVVPLVASISFFTFLSYTYAVCAAALVVCITILALTSIFSPDYWQIREHEKMEKKIMSYFPGFPLITSLNLVEDEKNVWLAYGHVQKEVMVQDVFKIVLELSGGDLSQDDNTPEPEYLYAKFSKKSSTVIEMCHKDSIQCFPITRLDINPCIK